MTLKSVPECSNSYPQVDCDHARWKHAQSYQEIGDAWAVGYIYDPDGDRVLTILDLNGEVQVTLANYRDEKYNYPYGRILIPETVEPIDPKEEAAAIASILGHTPNTVTIDLDDNEAVTRLALAFATTDRNLALRRRILEALQTFKKP